jgi:hypothetical protein
MVGLAMHNKQLDDIVSQIQIKSYYIYANLKLKLDINMDKELAELKDICDKFSKMSITKTKPAKGGK